MIYVCGNVDTEKGVLKQVPVYHKCTPKVLYVRKNRTELTIIEYIRNLYRGN